MTDPKQPVQKPLIDDEPLMSNEDIDRALGIEEEDELTPDPEGTKKGMICMKGQTIITQDHPSHHAYYVEYGRAEVVIEEDGHELVVAEIGPGEVFGEMGILEKAPRGASVRALEKCKVIPLSSKEIEERLDKVGDTMIKSVLDTLVRRLRKANVGQFSHYRKLSSFQDRLTGIMEKAEGGISAEKRKEFTEEVIPLLDQLEQILDKYKNK